MNEALLGPDVQEFLRRSQALNPAELALMKSPFPEVSSSELAGQLDGWQRSSKKIPLWHETQGIYFPDKLAMEQCSSALTAQYKAGLLIPGGRGADLTGGFGVDSYYFSRVSQEVVHCEIQPALSQIVQHNNQVLGASNISCQVADGLAWLNSSDVPLDYIYIDPSRRVNQQKVFTLDDVQPAIVQHQDELLRRAPIVIMKAAPLLDISAALRQLKHVAAVYVISIGNECKELLFMQQRAYAGKPILHCVLLGKQVSQAFSIDPDTEKSTESRFGPISQYLYEPDAALLKAGCFKGPGAFYLLDKLHAHTHLYTSDRLNYAFPGRIFRVKEVQDYGQFKKHKSPIKANIAIRNFPLSTEQLRKKHPILDGGENYLFFVTDHMGDLKVVFTEKA